MTSLNSVGDLHGKSLQIPNVVVHLLSEQLWLLGLWTCKTLFDQSSEPGRQNFVPVCSQFLSRWCTPLAQRPSSQYGIRTQDLQHFHVSQADAQSNWATSYSIISQVFPITYYPPNRSVLFFSLADGSTDFQPEAGRYHIYGQHLCPYANRTTIGRLLKGLESVISYDNVDYVLVEGKGWKFSPEVRVASSCSIITRHQCF